VPVESRLKGLFPKNLKRPKRKNRTMTYFFVLEQETDLPFAKWNSAEQAPSTGYKKQGDGCRSALG
jgi:hypothetical protein